MAYATEQEYGFWHKTFHWVVVGLITAQYSVGSAMPHIRKDTPNEGLVAWHSSIGTAILFFVVLRIVWRFLKPVSLLSMPTWQTRLAQFTHAGLYVLVVVMTLLGWASTSYLGWTINLFGLIPLPPLAAKGTEWAHTAGDIHDALVYVLLAFIVLHIGAALYHHFYLRDRVLQRMLPA